MDAETFECLFSDDAYQDATVLVRWLRRFGNTVLGEDPSIDEHQARTVLAHLHRDRPFSGWDSVSPFKKVGLLTAAFCTEQPVLSDFGSLAPDRERANALCAFMLCLSCLKGAVIIKERREEILSEPIRVSEHFLRDIIDGFAGTAGTIDKWHFPALLYEALAYRWNPDASYDCKFGPN